MTNCSHYSISQTNFNVMRETQCKFFRTCAKNIELKKETLLINNVITCWLDIAKIIGLLIYESWLINNTHYFPFAFFSKFIKRSVKENLDHIYKSFIEYQLFFNRNYVKIIMIARNMIWCSIFILILNYPALFFSLLFFINLPFWGNDRLIICQWKLN